MRSIPLPKVEVIWEEHVFTCYWISDHPPRLKCGKCACGVLSYREKGKWFFKTECQVCGAKVIQVDPIGTT